MGACLHQSNPRFHVRLKLARWLKNEQYALARISLETITQFPIIL
jgi:hypothetical protein